MARYFFDVMDGGTCLDDEGVEFPDVQSACKEALHALPDLAKSFPPEKISEEVVVTMRDRAASRSIARRSQSRPSGWVSRRRLNDAPTLPITLRHLFVYQRAPAGSIRWPSLGAVRLDTLAQDDSSAGNRFRVAGSAGTTATGGTAVVRVLAGSARHGG